MKRQAPPLSAVEAFIAATHSRSFSEAAGRMGLTRSAFTRRIQSLESFLRVPLFEREGSGVSLSLAGERYQREIESAIATIRRASVDLRAETEGAPLRLMTSQSFAACWLLPRLNGFLARHSECEVELKTGRGLDDLRSGLADLAILRSAGAPEGMDCEALAEVEAALLCAPVLANGLPPPHGMADLKDHQRLAVTGSESLWDQWLRHNGHDGGGLAPAIAYPTHFVMSEIAAAGLGVALGLPLLADRQIRDGRLVVCAGERAPTGQRYFLVYAGEAVRRRPDTQAFAAWLRQELMAFTA